MGKFANDVKKFENKFVRRFRATARGAVQTTLMTAQRTRGQGGRMRVDTGFLRASIQGSTTGMPSGPTTNVNDDSFSLSAQVAGKPIVQVLLDWHPERQQPLFVGWTANYARPREYKDGFLRGAVERWDSHVKVAAKIAEKGIA